MSDLGSRQGAGLASSELLWQKVPLQLCQPITIVIKKTRPTCLCQHSPSQLPLRESHLQAVAWPIGIITGHIWIKSPFLVSLFSIQHKKKKNLHIHIHYLRKPDKDISYIILITIEWFFAYIRTGCLQKQWHPAGALPARPHRGSQNEDPGRCGVQVRERGHPGPHLVRDARGLHQPTQVEHQTHGLHLLRLPYHRTKRPYSLHPRKAAGKKGCP